MSATHLTLIGVLYILTALICALHARPDTRIPTLTFDRHRLCEIVLGLAYIGSDLAHGAATHGYAVLAGIA